MTRDTPEEDRPGGAAPRAGASGAGRDDFPPLPGRVVDRATDGRFRSPIEYDWVAIRTDYEADELTVEEIAERHRVPLGTLYERRRVEGWPMRRGSSASERSVIISRLFRILDRQAQLLENEMKPSQAKSGEKEARVLSNLARTLDKLIAIDTSERKGRGPTRSGRDMAALRRELADRIVKLSKR